MKTQLEIGVWLVVLSVVFYVPIMILSMFGRSDSQLYTIGVTLNGLYVVASIYLLLIFKKLLNNQVKTNTFDTIIYILIAGSITSGLVSILGYFGIISQNSESILSIAYTFIIGCISIVYGIKIINLANNLYDLRKTYGVLIISSAVCFVTIVLLPVGLVLMLIGDIVFAVLLHRASKQIL